MVKRPVDSEDDEVLDILSGSAAKVRRKLPVLYINIKTSEHRSSARSEPALKSLDTRRVSLDAAKVTTNKKRMSSQHLHLRKLPEVLQMEVVRGRMATLARARRTTLGRIRTALSTRGTRRPSRKVWRISGTTSRKA